MGANRVFRLLFAAVLVFVSSGAFAKKSAPSNACKKLDPNSPEVPLCPENGILLNETYPVAAALVSDAMGGFGFVRDFTVKMISGQNRAPMIVATVSENNCAKLKAFIRREQKRANTTIPKDFSPENQIVCNTTRDFFCNQRPKKERANCINETNWQQDIGQPVFDASTGKPKFVMNDDYPYNSFGVTGALEKACGIEWKKVKLGDRNGSSGGNIESIPPGYCVIGTDQLNTPGGSEFPKVRAEFCDKGAELVVAPTSWLAVGHTDEIMGTVATSGAPPCNFKLLVADPSLGLDLIREGKDPVFDLNDKRNQNRFGTAEFKEICRYQPSTDQRPRSTPSTTTSIERILMDWILPKAEAKRGDSTDTVGLSGKSYVEQIQLMRKEYARLREEIRKGRSHYTAENYKEIEEVGEYFEKEFSKWEVSEKSGSAEWEDFYKEYYLERINDFKAQIIALSSLTEEQARSCVKSDNFLRGFEGLYGSVNRDIDSVLDGFASDLEAKLRSNPALKGCPGQFVERVPVLYTGKNSAGETAEKRLEFTHSDALVASPTNSLSFGKSQVFSDTGVTAFNRRLQEIAKSLGNNPSFIDTLPMDQQQGNVHCSSNLIRYCRPRGGS
jgi:hypothetical protein